MKLAGLIGHPVSHSLSPRIHSYWAAEHNIDTQYKLFTTAPARLRQTMLHMRKKDIIGVNITVPHKVSVIEYLNGLDDTAKLIGAVNTVINKQGQFIGSNTDAYGFITNLREGLTGDPHGDISKYLSNVLVLGAGGATRAILIALKEAGAKTITITNRTNEKAADLANEFHTEAVSWDERESALPAATLVVNTTSLGMDGHPPLVLDLIHLTEGAAVHDIVYAPLETKLLKSARARGFKTVDGLGMLLYQAQKAFEAWHGILPAVTPELRAHVLYVEPEAEQELDAPQEYQANDTYRPL